MESSVEISGTAVKTGRSLGGLSSDILILIFEEVSFSSVDFLLLTSKSDLSCSSRVVAGPQIPLSVFVP
jgi:hypothetical protein